MRQHLQNNTFKLTRENARLLEFTDNNYNARSL